MGESNASINRVKFFSAFDTEAKRLEHAEDRMADLKLTSLLSLTADYGYAQPPVLRTDGHGPGQVLLGFRHERKTIVSVLTRGARM